MVSNNNSKGNGCLILIILFIVFQLYCCDSQKKSEYRDWASAYDKYYGYTHYYTDSKNGQYDWDAYERLN